MINLLADKYPFIKNEIFKNHPIQLLTLSGSISYGTNNENSDIDIRGFFLENINELFSIEKRFENYTDPLDDITLYSLQTFVTLLSNCNPNVIELLGVNKEHIIYESLIAKSLRDNASMFLSKQAYHAFAGYANTQLRRLQNALARDEYDTVDKEKHILKTIQYELERAKNDFLTIDSQYCFNAYIDKNEIVTDLNFKKISLRKLASHINQLHATIRNFDKLNHRNRKKDSNHLNKHAMHLIRLLFTGIDILQNGIIRTYRPNNELALLRDIRKGNVPYNDIFKLSDELEIKIKKAAETSKLPDKPNMDIINSWLKDIYINFFREEKIL